MAAVSDQVLVDDVGQVPFEAPACLRSLGLGELALAVDLPWTWITDLADCDDV
jgi:hypothetical protein